MSKPTIFISYSHKDEEWKNRLVTHLGVLQQQGYLDIWVDTRIESGGDWFQEIKEAIDATSIAVLIISADFLNSKFITEKEVPMLLQQRKENGLRIFPIILKPCDWLGIPWLKQFMARPTDGRRLSAGIDNQIETDLAAIAREIRELLERAGLPREPREYVPLPPDQGLQALLKELARFNNGPCVITTRCKLTNTEHTLDKTTHQVDLENLSPEVRMQLLREAVQNQFPQAWDDLEEARELAERGNMKLFLADYHLEAARVVSRQLAVTSRQSAVGGFRVMVDGREVTLNREEMIVRLNMHSEQAEKLVQKTGYHRRDPEVELGYAGLFFAQGDQETAREHLGKAKALLDKMGIRCWDFEVRRLEQLIG